MGPNPYHLEMVRQGAGGWNRWRVDSQVTTPELEGADLSDFNLSGYQLAGIELCEANLSRANLAEVDLSDANLSMAYLIEANLFRANLSGANLLRANMAKANCFGVDFTKANMAEVNFSGANLTMADFTMANLSKANLSGANLLRACLQDTLGSPDGGDDCQKYSSLPILTPALVHKKNLITKDMLIGIGRVILARPLPIQLSFVGETSYQLEKTLTNALIDVMKAFGFSLIGNINVSGKSFCATFEHNVKESSSAGKMKENLLALYEGVSGALTKNPSRVRLTTKERQALENFIMAILARPIQAWILIDTLLIEREEAMVQIHLISYSVRDKLVNDPEMLNSPKLAEIIVEDRRQPERLLRT